MSKVLVDRILQRYGLKGASIRDAMKGYRNESYACELPDSRLVNLILYKREDGILHRIRCADYVSNFLASQGMPARASADPRIVRLRSGTAIKYAALYKYLPGSTIPWEAYTMKHLKALGAAQSDMHFLLAPLQRHKLSSVITECTGLSARMQTYFAQDGVRQALAAKLRLKPPLIKTDPQKYRTLPSQPLHMDLVRGNILFDDSARITGILDFEKAAWGPTAFDLARTLAFLLVDCKYKDESKIRKYFLHSGYNKRGNAAFGDWAAMEELVDFFLIHDLYKFLRHNPYESLELNEHFIRTRDLLLKRNVLSYAKVLK